MKYKSFVDKTHTIKILQDLISINSVNPSLVPGAPGEVEIAEYIADFLNSLGLKTSIINVQKGRPNVIGKSDGNEPVLMLNGHMDTVGVDYMRTDPFKPVKRNGNIYGRGAADMKGGLAAILSAAKAVMDSGCELKGSLLIAAVCDEEHASIGTERLMKDTHIDAAVVGEPTDLDILVAHKGFAWIDIETRGIAAHGSAWDKGIDAIAKMGKVQVGLENYMNEQLLMKTHPMLGPSTVHSSIISGGRELSTYPDACKLQVERRLIPGETKEDIDKEFELLLSSIRKIDNDFDGDFEIIFFRGPMEVSSDEEICRILSDYAMSITGVKPNFIGKPYWLDTQIISEYGVPVVAFGPKGYGLHSAVEYVEINSVLQCTVILEGLIKKYCGLV
ncbi:ArgE/DapE family deacylase [Candidatus Bathyarchaeota archaeon]|nr:ArgE/DapE family deacylase [Candidatus Bathyarchaeota archaeon]